MTITDETLSAFLDGELSGEEHAQVEAAIAADPALEARVSALAAATRRFAAAIREADKDPMPAGVADLLRPKVDNVVAFRPKKREQPKWAAPAAIAASLLALVVAAGLFGDGPGGGARVMIAAGPIDKASPLHRALDRTASAASEQIGRSSIRPVATFRVAGGALCREFVASQEKGAVRAVACRDDRQWTVKIAATEAASAGGYQPASGPAAAISAYVDSAIEGDALGPDEERALIDAKWRANE